MNCKLCDKLILSTSVVDTGDNLVVTIPAGIYANGNRYCIVPAQTIPTTATIAEPVVIQIGVGGATYPLMRRDCRPVTACGIRTRTRYAVCVETTATGGVFRLLGKACGCGAESLPALEG